MLKSITGYRHSRWKSGLDMDSSPLNIMHASFDQRQRQIQPGIPAGWQCHG
jgi:iron complex outermembrane receptor protein